MKLGTLCGFLFGSVMLSMTVVVQADVHDGSGQGVQNAMDQHDKNIEEYRVNNPDKELPKGLVHSREVLESIKAGERPERPDLPDMSMRPERPVKPVRPARPERPDMARR